MAEIKNIVFDVGRVLIDVNYASLFAFLREHKATIQTEEAFVRLTDMRAFERGLIDDETFLNNMAALFPRSPGHTALRDIWLDQFSPINEMLALAIQLKQNYGVYLLSNTNSLHWQHIVPAYNLADIGHGLITSYETGCAKPDPAIFHQAEQHFNLSPESTIFIDDIEDNAAGARACGWHGIQHISLQTTRSRLSLLGVIL